MNALKVIPKELRPLAVEARKYKGTEEKAKKPLLTIKQFTKILRKRFGDKVPLYHGTSKEVGDAVASGDELDGSRDSNRGSWGWRGGLFFTIGKPDYKGRGVVLRYDVPTDLIMQIGEVDPDDIRISDVQFEKVFRVAADEVDSDERTLNKMLLQNSELMGLPLMFRGGFHVEFTAKDGSFLMPHKYFVEAKESRG
ncbi:MAG: hypothetical protein WC976_06605 [Caldisericia bacterium]